MRSVLLTVCSRVMFLLNLVCVNTASIAVLGNVSNQKRKTRFSKACRPQKPSTPALETWTTTSLTGYTPLHAVQANTRSNHSRIYRRPAQVGRPHSHTVGHGESSQTVWNDHALPTDRFGEAIPLPKPMRSRKPILPNHVQGIGRHGVHSHGEA